MSSFGLIEKYMKLSHIYLAVQETTRNGNDVNLSNYLFWGRLGHGGLGLVKTSMLNFLSQYELLFEFFFTIFKNFHKIKISFLLYRGSSPYANFITANFITVIFQNFPNI